MKIVNDAVPAKGSMACYGPLIKCHAVIDTRSSSGPVTIIDSDNSVIKSIPTNPESVEPRFMDIQIPEGCTLKAQCHTAVRFYTAHPNPTLPPRPIDEVKKPQIDQKIAIQEAWDVTPAAAQYKIWRPELVVRIQVSPNGKLSLPYHQDVMHPKITSMVFFSWFSCEVNDSLPSPKGGFTYPLLFSLCRLAFTLKDAIPKPETKYLTRGDEDQFIHIRRYILQQADKAAVLCPGLKEFVILVTVPEQDSTEDCVDKLWA